MNDASIRDRLANAQGAAYWRCLEELLDAQEFRTLLRRHFPPDLPEPLDPLGRRKFLGLLAASLGLAGLSGCGLSPPQEKIVPYVRQPEGMVLGVPRYYASTAVAGGDALGVLVESHEGRPTKIEGNAQHAASLGGSDAWAQASILTLYDPDRSQTVTYLGQIRTWETAQRTMQSALVSLRARHGAGLRLLTPTVVSPTLGAQLEALLSELPEARWHQYEPAGADAARAGARLAYGKYVNTYYRLERAERIVSLDADFLFFGPGHVRYARDFSAGRRAATRQPGDRSARMNRLYAVECTPSVTGAKADHRWALAPSQVEGFARALAARLDERFESLADPAFQAIPASVVQEIARDLREHRQASVVIPGLWQAPAVHALAHAMNQALGSVGQTVIHTDPIEARPSDQSASLRELLDDMDHGRVELLVILGGNPVYDAPADLEFGRHLTAEHSPGKAKVPLRVHLGEYRNETAQLCHWHVPEAHFLESWSDARAYDGTASLVQPLIAPLYAGRTAHELVATLCREPQRPDYELLRNYWRAWFERQDAERRKEGFERFWQVALHDGVIAGSALPAVPVELRDGWMKELPQPTSRGAGSALELAFRPDPAVFDGRWANNAWLQELPRPLTKLTWDNAALVSPATAEKLGLKSRVGWNGGERGQSIVDVVELRVGGRMLPAVPVCIVPGHPDDAVTLHLGYGRTHAGAVGNATGVNAYALRTAAAPWSAPGAELRPTGGEFVLACTQFHHSMEARQPVHAVEFAEYAAPGKEKEKEKEREKKSEQGEPVLGAAGGEHQPSLLPAWPYEGYKWAMAINLSACIGCNACVVACQAENNIPVVGKDQVLRARAMHWIRIDRYYQGDAAHARTFFQPVPCMHCETAPCEVVCPVEATVHSVDGLNDMVYNRCVGTRYCSNNCPYKVRRFNFLAYSDFTTPTVQMLHNPDVTVRSRGVMEKCTYCVQRIREAEIRASREDRTIRAGEVQTACQAACPAGAIVFGNLNEKESVVRAWREHPLGYGLLDDVNTRPRTTYLAALWNPNPHLKAS